jgi:hypothetical protein
MTKLIFGRIQIPAGMLTGRPEPKIRYLAARRKRFRRRMVLAGIRPASIDRYLNRGFYLLGPWAMARREEMNRMIMDIDARRRLAKREERRARASQ